MKNQLIKKTILYIVIIIGAVISIFPFYWMFIGSTNSSGEIFSNPPKFIPGDQFFVNWQNINQSVDILKVTFNSIFIATTFTVLSLFITSIAGYAFAKFKFRGRNFLFFVLLMALMIPYHVTLIPLFEMFVALDWLNTYQAVILPQLAYPFAIFLMRQNMKGLPDSLIEAARVDGAGEFRIFFTIALPAMKPALAAVAIYLFMFQWNNFLWPLIILNSDEMYTLPVALSSLIGLTKVDYGQVMMGAAISVVPIMIVFLLLQKHFVSGILGGAVKE